MITAWIVFREERHIDNRFWVCLNREDALKIAADIVAYWVKKYKYKEDDLDRKCYGGDRIFNCCGRDGFHVYVELVMIRQPGETNKEEVR